jgi:hypothetical protein
MQLGETALRSQQYLSPYNSLLSLSGGDKQLEMLQGLIVTVIEEDTQVN